jgi:hypothetical protein
MLKSEFLSNQCDGWFRKSSSELPRAMKPLKEESLHKSSSPRTLLEGDASKLRYMSAFNDRESFKNLSIYVSQLPITPNCFREKYVRSSISATPSHTPRMPTNAVRAEPLALQFRKLSHRTLFKDSGKSGKHRGSRSLRAISQKEQEL